MRRLIGVLHRRQAWLSLVVVALLALAQIAAAQPALDFPPLTGRVVDEAGLLSPSERESLTQALAQHEQSTGQQVVVVTLKSLRDRTIEDYGYQLGRHWGIGAKDKNTGALFVIAPRERKVRIEVGYGLEGTLTDAASHLIIENIVLPAFRSGQFGPGIVAGTGAILKTLAGDEGAAPKPAKAARDDSVVPLIVLFIIVLFVLSAMGRYRRPQPGGLYDRRGGWRTGGMIGGLGGGFGGRGGGDWGGGGFSGGGGSFGGGGASGDW
ncbi:MAG: TPM domain-containing protein [Rhodospirillales bacterium]